MSAFLVSQETLNKVVSIYADGKPCEQLDDLGRRLWSLNQQAVRQRYGEVSDVPQFHYRLRSYPQIEKLKALQCLIYQCSEGDVPKQALYQQLRDKERSLSSEIISKLPAWQSAPWDG